MHRNPPLSGDRARDRESGSVNRKEARDPRLDSSDDAESSGGKEFLSGSIILARERRF